ncbi:MAG: NACHT domain-containing protein, partial [Gammaproteobacteria bacterium]|nr:NACHT domain-containing protein [Gammaproteobacteria bacterium]
MLASVLAKTVTTVFYSVQRVYHIKKQSEKNRKNIANLEERVNRLDTLLDKFRQDPAYVSFVREINETLNLAREYIALFRTDTFYQKGIRTFYVDKINKEVIEKRIEISEAVEFALLRIVGELSSLYQKNTETSITLQSNFTSLHSELKTLNHNVATYLQAIQEANNLSNEEAEQESRHTEDSHLNQLAELLFDQHTVLDQFSDTVTRILEQLSQRVDNLELYATKTTEQLNQVSQQITLLSSARSLPISVNHDQCDFIRHRLKIWYQRDDIALVRLDVGDEMRTIRVDQLFINLAIVEENIKKRQEEVIATQRYQNIHHEERDQERSFYPTDTIERQQIVKIEELFDQHVHGSWERIPSSVLMLGRAGVGKTTLCHYQTYRWATDDLWLKEIKWIFTFQLKKVANHRKLEQEQRIHRILYEMILCHFPDLLLENQVEAFWQLLLQSQQPILFILDGYDEVSDRQHPACEALMSVMTHCPGSALKVLITSRPYARINQPIDIVLENIGFIKEDIPRYIKRYFDHTDEDTSKQQRSRGSSYVLRHGSIDAPLEDLLINWLDDRPKIRQICSVPIHLELLCSVWQVNSDRLIVGDVVMSDLYGFMIEKIVRRYLRKTLSEERLNTLKLLNSEQVMALTESQEIMNFLKKLAYEGITTGNIIIQKRLFSRVVSNYSDVLLKQGGLQRLLSTGFLKAVGDYNEDPLEMDYHFIHLSFQEYLTACYLSHAFLDEFSNDGTKRFIDEHRYDPTYQLVWTYVANLLAENKTALRNYFRLLTRSPRDIFGMYELDLLVRCGEEAKWPDTPLMQAILSYLGHWTLCMSNLNLQKKPHERYFLHHMIRLYHDCPHAMSRVQYKDQVGLLNLLMYEARDRVWIDAIEQALAAYATFANLGCDFVFYTKQLISHSVKSDILNGIINILLSPLYGALKVISFCLHAVIFLVGNFPLLWFLKHLEYTRGIQRNVLNFMGQFEFNDKQSVVRSLVLLTHSDPKLKFRMMKALASIRFAPEIFPYVTRTLLKVLEEEPDFAIRKIYYQQLVDKLSTHLGHNEALRFFNYTLYYFCQHSFNPFRSRMLEQALQPFYPAWVVQKAVIWSEYIVKQRILSRLVQRDPHSRDVLFCLDGLILLLNHHVYARDQAVLLEAILPLVTWQYVDLVEPTVKMQFEQNLLTVLKFLQEPRNQRRRFVFEEERRFPIMSRVCCKKRQFRMYSMLLIDIFSVMIIAIKEKQLSFEVEKEHMTRLHQLFSEASPETIFSFDNYYNTNRMVRMS